MDNAAHAPERAENPSQESTAPPPGWAAVQESLAAAAGLSVLLVGGRQPPSLHVSNNNSICRAFQSSPNLARLCDPFCGEAHRRALAAGEATHYRCHAGLHCVAAPLPLRSGGRQLAVIAGRAFLRSTDYRALAERLRGGDLGELLSPELFRNVIFALPKDLDELASRVSEAATDFAGGAVETPESTSRAGAEAKVETAAGAEGRAAAPKGRKETKREEAREETKDVTGEETAAEAADDRRGFAELSAPARGFPATASLSEVCRAAVEDLAREHRIESVALMFRSDEKFAPTCTTGRFKSQPPRVSLKAKEIKLLQNVTQGESIAVPAGGRTATKHEDSVELFPLVIGGEIKGALIVGDRDLSDEQREAVSRFCRDMAMPLEVLRLRDELERRMRAATHLQAFTERINSVKPEEAYSMILRHSAELLRAERGSLLLFDEDAGELHVKAALGPRSENLHDARVPLGEWVAGKVLSEGRPLVVRDLLAAGKPTHAERSYKTNSFISYPITISGRKVGVLNVTDKAGGGPYDEMDLSLLEMIAPQMALALDRAEWHQKATQFQLLSITDPLTGLLNRRYLEERLSEELERSKRHRFQMSFMMVDIDDFKRYNDVNGHQAGDLALEMTASCMKSVLRSADVASRYGGEEFSILLPQTGLSEAHVIAERIRRRVWQTQFPHGKQQPHGGVTVSIGISSFAPGLDTPASIIYAADQALYQAKSRGKNCVDAFDPDKFQDANPEAK
ncbi:MAG TPA: diguanylate cyclase [Pyrinomonadaceae bacterium]|nr:diguanylate cyclase [Pyrinomonadaceae bacterium]